MPIPNYPLDLTAVLPSNHITGEVHVITTPQSRFFVPVGGPFFTQSMILRNNVTNALLMPNNDFKILHHHAEGSAATGKNVCAIIYITNPLIASVNLEYQCVGGVYSDTSDIIRQMIVDHPLDPDQPQLIGWEQVFGQPNQYPSSAHQHLANQFWGYGDLVAGIEQLRVAVASGDNAAMAAIYRYIELMINNNNYLTAADLNGLLQTPDTFIKTHPTYNALRNRTDFSDNLPVVYMTIGKVTTSDGRGMMFRWEPASMAIDEDEHVLRPASRLVTEPGRLVSLLNAENVLQRYGVDAPIGRAGVLAANRDLDTVTLPGKYYVETTQPNRPFDNAVLEVELVTGTMLDQSSSYIIQTVRGRRQISTRVCTSGVWERWVTVLNNHMRMGSPDILDTTVDFNNVVKTGQYYFVTNLDGTATPPHRPFGVAFGMLEVFEIEDVSDTQNNHIIQNITTLLDNDLDDNTNAAHNPYQNAVFRATKYTRVRFGGIWSQWARELNWETAQRHALHTPILESHYLNETKDLNDNKIPGKYAFVIQAVNSPFDNGVLEVIAVFSDDSKYENVVATLGVPFDVLQIATNETQYAIRRYHNGAWDDWTYYISRVVLNAALATLGRKVNDDYTINTDYADIGLSITDDLDIALTPGHYWVTPTAINKPAGAFDGYLTVINTDIWYTQIYISTFHDVDYLDTNPNPAVGAAKIFIRNGYFTLGNPSPWQPWQPLVDIDTLNLALNTLGRSIKTNYSLETYIATLGHTQGADLNLVVASGLHWVDNTCTNRPPNVDNGMLYVERAADHYVFQRMQGGQNAAVIVDNTANRTDYTEHTRIGVRAPNTTDPFVWSAWESTLTKTRGIVNGIDARLAETNVAGPNLNTHARTGVLWVEDSQLNRAFSWAILKVTTLNSADTIQEMYNKDNYAIRYGYGGTNYTGHTWSDWQFRANLNGDVDETFRMYSHPSNLIDDTHGINAWYLSTQFAAPLWERLTANGIDADLGTTNALFTVDLDDVRDVGEYYINDCSNSPHYDGLLKVWRFDYRHIYQILHGSNNTVYSRYGYRTIFGVWSWTPWSGLLSTSSQRTEVFEIHIGGYTTGSGTRTYVYTVAPNDISFEIRLVSAGGPGAGGGGAANNSNEDYGGGGGGGGSSGAMALIQMVGVLPGSTINVSLGQPGAAGGISGTYGGSGTNSDSTYLSVYEPGGYGTTFAIELQGGRGGSYGWAGGTNSSTAGGGGAQVTANVSIEGFYNYRVLLGEAGGGGTTAGWQGGSGGYGGAISQQCSGSSRTSGGAGSGSGNGSPGFDGLTPTSPPYQFGRGGGGGGGGRNGSSVGGVGGAGGVAGCIIRVTRNKV